MALLVHLKPLAPEQLGALPPFDVVQYGEGQAPAPEPALRDARST